MAGQPVPGRQAGRVAIVTGAAQGLGRAYAQRLAAEGAAVAVVDVLEDLARESAALLPRAIAIRADVGSGADTLRMAEETLHAFGRIDVLVNNAGGALVPARPFFEMSEEDWDRVIDVNLKGQWLCVRAVFPAMREQERGRIINISSTTERRGYPEGLSPYIAAKAGVLGMTRALAHELGRYNITVNAVTPGYTPVPTPKEVHTPAAATALRQHMIDEQCLKRSETPDDLAAAIAYLASDDAEFVTGQVLNVDGGWVHY